jgi:predicted RNase H-like nuclease (RuvC/YqgF family)
MELKNDALYSIKETAFFVGMSERMLQMYAKKNDFRKIDNRYLFSGHEISKLLNKRNEKEAKRKLNYRNVSQEFDNLNLTITNLQQENTKLKLQVEVLSKENESLKTQRNIESEILENENLKLKEQLKEDVPHQEKLKKAIQLITLEAMEQNVTHKVFTDEEYQDLIGTISEVDFQTKQVEYLKSRVEKQDGILKELVDQVTQRNFIYAKDKGYDKK